jgi:hypothetical protein
MILYAPSCTMRIDLSKFLAFRDRHSMYVRAAYVQYKQEHFGRKFFPVIVKCRSTSARYSTLR